jgi:ABC-type antimicrobial peptide transport system permease subunit
LFTVVALFILTIACINFMNLATARAGKRSKEVGVRKVMGAVRGLLVRQFLGESMLMSVLALGLALLLVWAMMPLFNQIAGKQLVIELAGCQPLAAVCGHHPLHRRAGRQLPGPLPVGL